ncbi:succinate dehydrogenase, hydrophobic membrane anchor protein [soil metagenome]
MSHAPKGIGPTRLVVGAHYGTRDFLGQRITALFLAVYTVYFVVMLLIAPSPIQYVDWVGIFNWSPFGAPVGKLLAFLAFFSIVYHAWIGIRDIWMDYIKPDGIRLTLQVLTIVWLLGSLAWAAQILWKI